MSEKLRNENVGESQRDIQKDVQSPSVSSFDQKKEFFEQVLTTKEEVPKEEIQTEQKKEIIEDLQTIGEKQKGKSFEEKKEFFENIDKVEDTPSPTPSPSQQQSQQQDKISPTEVWRNKYEGESQSPIGSETSDLEVTDRSSQQVFDSNKGSSNQSLQGKDTSGSNVPFLHQDKDTSTQSQDSSWQSNKDQKESFSGSGISSLQQGKDDITLGTESTLKGRDTSFGSESSVKQGKDTSNKSQDFGSGVSSFQQDKSTSSPSQGLSYQSQQRKDTSGSDVPLLQQDKGISTQSQDSSWQSNKDQKESFFGSEIPLIQQPSDVSVQSKDLSTHSQQGIKYESQPTVQHDIPLGTESTLKGRDTSFGNESSVKQGKDTSDRSQDFGSGISSFQQDKSTSSPSQGLSYQSEQGKDTSGSDVPLLQQDKGISTQSQDSSWQSNKNQKESFSGSGVSSLQQGKDDIPLGTESTLKGRDTSFGNESLLQQGKDTSNQSQKGKEDTSFGSESSLKGKDDTAFGSFFPKEGQTTQQGDLINFGQQNESEKQGQESSFVGSVSSTLPQEISGSGQSKQKKDCCNNEDCSCKVGECDCNDKKDDNLKSRIKRKKAFEPKDPSQFTSGPKVSENKSN